jgi:hypothetical protein
LENEVKAKLGMIKNNEDVKNDDGQDKQKQKDKKSK